MAFPDHSPDQRISYARLAIHEEGEREDWQIGEPRRSLRLMLLQSITAKGISCKTIEISFVARAADR